MAELTELKLTILRGMAKFPTTEFLSREVANMVPDNLLPQRRGKTITRSNFIANRIGPLLGKMAKEGYTVGRKNLGKYRAGEGSYWKLGPLADKLIDEGKL